GVQMADMFYTAMGTRATGDVSSDMVEQFLKMTGIQAPIQISESLGTDTAEALSERQKWLWSPSMRRKWLEFYAIRWEQFTKKLADALHSAGKKLMVLAQYCTDPVETYYCLGST
ncbi:MAG: hypothetical protein IK088_01810, partial [Lachnospiraceae bacterium]|nr:hypothetical protein [Lachnospiraceae bacterium]